MRRNLGPVVVSALALLWGTGRPAAGEDPPPAEPVSAGTWSAEQLKELVGPVALYPDVVLTSLLPASAYPDDIPKAAEWLAAQPEGQTPTVPTDVPWDKSVQALVQFPDVVAWLNENLDWTRQLGNAVAAQQSDVLTAIQAFRRDAQAAGNLETNEQIAVTTGESESGEPESDVIVIESADPEVVYVPAYDPVAVMSPGYTGLAWASGIAVGVAGAAVWNNIDWGDGYNGGGDININNEMNFSNVEGGDRVGPNRPTDWKPPEGARGGPRAGATAKPGPGPGARAGAGTGARPGTGPSTRPGAGPSPGPGSGARPGAGGGGAKPTPAPRPAGGGGVKAPTAAPKVAGMKPGGAGGGGGKAPKAAPKKNPPNHAYGGAGNGASTRAASERGGSSMRSGGQSSSSLSGRGGSGGGSKSGGGGGGGGGRGGGGGGRRR